MSSGLLIREHGRILSVRDEQRGSALAQDELASATTIHLSDVSDFDDHGGQLSIAAALYVYDSLDETANTLHLTTGLAANTSDATPVYVSPAVYDRWALVRVDDVYDSAEGTYALIPFGLYASLPLGQRDQEGEEWVTLVKDGDVWKVQDVSSDVSGLRGGIGQPSRGVTLGTNNDETLSDTFTLTAGGSGGFSFTWSSLPSWLNSSGEIIQEGVYYYALWFTPSGSGDTNYLMMNVAVEHLGFFVPVYVLNSVGSNGLPVGIRAYGVSDLLGNPNGWFYKNEAAYNIDAQFYIARLAF